MPLSKQVISIPMKLGVDTKESPILVDNARFLNLKNVVFDRGSLGELHKRWGTTQLPSTDSNGNPIVSPTGLALFNDELDLLASDTFYSYGKEINAWTPQGFLMQFGVKETLVESGIFTIQTPDSASLSGVTVYAWVQWDGSENSVYAKVTDAASGKVYSPTIKILSNGANPKVLAVGTKIVILCTLPDGSLVSFSVDPTAPTSIGAQHTIIAATTLLASSLFDACVCNGDLVIGVNSNIPSIWLYTVNTSTLAVVASTVLSSADFAGTAFSICSVGNDALLAVVSTVTGTTTVKSWMYSIPALSNVRGPDTIATGITGCPRLTAARVTSTSALVLYELANGPNTLNSIAGATVDVSAGVTSFGTFSVGVSLAGQIFVPTITEAGPVFVLTVYESEVQQTFFFQRIDTVSGALVPTVQGKFYQWTAGPAPGNSRMPAMAKTTTSETMSLVVPYEAELEAEAGKPVIIDGIAKLAIVAPPGPTSAAQLGQSLMLASGALLWNWDGSTLTEHGFSTSPETPQLAFLTSHLAIIVDNNDPTAGTPQAVSIYVPDNGASPGGPVGQLVTPGEYFCFNGFVEAIHGTPTTANPNLYWFSVDGNGSAPSGGNFSGFTINQIALTSSMTAVQVAAAIYNVLWFGSNLSSNYIVTAPAAISLTTGLVGQRIVVTARDNTSALSQPALNRVFSVMQSYVGTAATYFPCWTITCCPANLIQGGQFFEFSIYSAASATHVKQFCYVWFEVGGVGVDPAPFPSGSLYLSGVKVTLTGTESADAVAALVEAALQGAFSDGSGYGLNVYGPSVGGFGPVVGVQCNDKAQIFQPSDYPANPITGGVAQSYIGANLNGVPQLLAVNYTATYQQINAGGELQQSDPAVPATAYIPAYVTVGGTFPPPGTVVPPNAAIAVSVQNLQQTLKQEVTISMWRTVSNPPANELDQVYYLITDPTDPVLNQLLDLNPSMFDDFSSDTGIISNQALYTSGGVLENDPPPACGFIINHQDRVWISSLEDPALLWFSKEFQAGLGVAFSVYQTQRLNAGVGPKVCGPITSAASMDGNLEVFQLNQPWLITGAGPDNTGNNGSFTAVVITSNVGCRDPGSVAVTPDGILRKTSQGIYLGNRQLADGYAGVDVAAYNADVVVRTIISSNGTRALFLSTSGTCLIYDFFYGSWGTLDYQAIDGILDASGVYTFIRASDGAILQENVGSFEDVATGYQMSVTTAKLKFAGINGFQRIWKFFIQGQFYASQGYQVSITYDDESSPTDVFTYTPGSNCTSIRVDNSRQLCKAMTITIEDVSPYATGTTWAFDAIDLEVGVRKGGTKTIGATRSLG